ncbi:unnamed protein product [Urochloa decumbens]|uniref:Uncharacterized protein n=1 Tax=Urochloa decumbens TaxID=240449 RepID=A0ABC9AIR4_9POAL
MPPTSSRSSANGGSGSMSTVVADTATGWHVLRISSYSATKALLGNGKFIKSSTFNVGGHTWHIKFFPAGYDAKSVGCISVFLYLDEIAGQNNVVNGRLKFSLLDRQGKTDSAYSQGYGNLWGFRPVPSLGWGYDQFIKTNWLWKESKHFKNDCFSIRCDVMVMLGLRTETVVPSSDLHQDLGELLSSRQGADVTFDVNGDLFTAHRNILGARSSVFKVELFGVMKEKTGVPVVIRDMEARVFKALLHFIYTDSLPGMDVGEENEIVMAQHLLVAADRYDLKRLKLISENKLCSRFTKRTAITTLVLAEQHGCRGLKEACFAYLSSLGSLKAVMDTDGYDHLRRSCQA